MRGKSATLSTSPVTSASLRLISSCNFGAFSTRTMLPKRSCDSVAARCWGCKVDCLRIHLRPTPVLPKDCSPIAGLSHTQASSKAPTWSVLIAYSTFPHGMIHLSASSKLPECSVILLAADLGFPRRSLRTIFNPNHFMYGLAFMIFVLKWLGPAASDPTSCHMFCGGGSTREDEGRLMFALPMPLSVSLDEMALRFHSEPCACLHLSMLPFLRHS